MVRHLVTATQAAAEDVITELDASLGLPRCNDPARWPEAQAWIDGGMVGDPPPHGLTLTAASVVQHPTLPLFAVSLPDRPVPWLSTPGEGEDPGVEVAYLDLLLGKTVAGIGPIQASAAEERTPDWTPVEVED